MNLEDIKKLSEIFNNFAQPIVTLIVAVVGYKATKKVSKSKKRRRK